MSLKYLLVARLMRQIFASLVLKNITDNLGVRFCALIICSFCFACSNLPMREFSNRNPASSDECGSLFSETEQNPLEDRGEADGFYPEYPRFDVTYVSPPNKKTNEIVQENTRYYFNLLRSDPNLKKLSDKELEESALKVVSWRLLIRAYSGLASAYDPPTASPGAGFNMEKYRMYLKAAGIDPDTRPPSFQVMLARFGYKSLAHGTSIEGLLKILKLGKLVSVEAGKQETTYEYSNSSYVYLEALPKTLETFYFKRYPVKKSNWDPIMPIYIEIDSAVLDQLRWSHFNVYWKHGMNDPGFSIQPSRLLAGFFNMLKEVPVSDQHEIYKYEGFQTTSQVDARNEFLFTEEVPLSYVKGIYINPVLKDKVISQLKSLGVDQTTLDKIH